MISVLVFGGHLRQNARRNCHKATRNKIYGAFIVSINSTQVFNKSAAINLLADLHSQGIKTFEIQFAPEHKMSSQQQWKQLDEFNLFAPDWTTENTAQIDLNAICAIASICTGLPISELIISDDMIRLSINAIGSNTTTPAEEALGTFTCRKLKKLDNWNNWLQAEQKLHHQSPRSRNVRRFNTSTARSHFTTSTLELCNTKIRQKLIP